MGSSGSKVKEVCEIKAVEEMDESELSHKDKMFRNAILKLADELKAVKNQKKDALASDKASRSIRDKFIYRLPVQVCNYSLL